MGGREGGREGVGAKEGSRQGAIPATCMHLLKDVNYSQNEAHRETGGREGRGGKRQEEGCSKRFPLVSGSNTKAKKLAII